MLELRVKAPGEYEDTSNTWTAVDYEKAQPCFNYIDVKSGTLTNIANTVDNGSYRLDGNPGSGEAILQVKFKPKRTMLLREIVFDAYHYIGFPTYAAFVRLKVFVNGHQKRLSTSLPFNEEDIHPTDTWTTYKHTLPHPIVVPRDTECIVEFLLLIQAGVLGATLYFKNGKVRYATTPQLDVDWQETSGMRPAKSWYAPLSTDRELLPNDEISVIARAKYPAMVVFDPVLGYDVEWSRKDSHVDENISGLTLNGFVSSRMPVFSFGSVVTSSWAAFAAYPVPIADGLAETLELRSNDLLISAAEILLTTHWLALGSTYSDGDPNEENPTTTTTMVWPNNTAETAKAFYNVRKRNPVIRWVALPTKNYLADTIDFHGAVEDPLQPNLKDFLPSVQMVLSRRNPRIESVAVPVAQGSLDSSGAFSILWTILYGGQNVRWLLHANQTDQYRDVETDRDESGNSQVRTMWEQWNTRLSLSLRQRDSSIVFPPFAQRWQGDIVDVIAELRHSEGAGEILPEENIQIIVGADSATRTTDSGGQAVWGGYQLTFIQTYSVSAMYSGGIRNGYIELAPSTTTESISVFEQLLTSVLSRFDIISAIFRGQYQSIYITVEASGRRIQIPITLLAAIKGSPLQLLRTGTTDINGEWVHSWVPWYTDEFDITTQIATSKTQNKNVIPWETYSAVGDTRDFHYSQLTHSFRATWGIERDTIWKNDPAIVNVTLQDDTTGTLLSHVPVKLQIQLEDVWIDIKTVSTNANGVATIQWDDRDVPSPASLLSDNESIVIPCRVMIEGFEDTNVPDGEPYITYPTLEVSPQSIIIQQLPIGSANLRLKCMLNNEDIRDVIERTPSTITVTYKLLNGKTDYEGNDTFTDPYASIIVLPDLAGTEYEVECTLTVGDITLPPKSNAATLMPDSESELTFSFITYEPIDEAEGRIHISIRLSQSLVSIGDLVEVSGAVTRPTRFRTFNVPFVRIHLMSGAETLGTARVGADGSYMLTFSPTQKGDIPLQACIKGPLGQMEVAKSAKLTLKVT